MLFVGFKRAQSQNAIGIEIISVSKSKLALTYTVENRSDTVKSLNLWNFGDSGFLTMRLISQNEPVYIPCDMVRPNYKSIFLDKRNYIILQPGQKKRLKFKLRNCNLRNSQYQEGSSFKVVLHYSVNPDALKRAFGDKTPDNEFLDSLYQKETYSNEFSFDKKK